MPGEATSALVLVTTREASKRGKVRIATPADKAAGATFRFPKKGTRSAVMVVPVVGSQVTFVGSKKATVQLRVEVLGYALNAKPVKVRSATATRIIKARLDAGAMLPIGPVTGIAGLPKKAKKITAVILQVTTKAKGPDAGALKAYGLDKPPPGTRSAPIVPGTRYTTLVVAEIGTDGKLAFTPSVPAKVTASIVGWIRR